MALVAAVRLRGKVDVRGQIEKSMQLLGLRKKHALVVFEESPDIKGMLLKAKDFITFGPVKEETVKAVYKAKGIEGDFNKENNPIHLAPPRGGFKSIKRSVRAHGDLGRREEMDSLLKRMIA